jgi:predicted transcriptional regulator
MDKYAKIIAALTTPLETQELVYRCGLNSGSVHAIMRNLEKRGFVTKTASHNQYGRRVSIYSRNVDQVVRSEVLSKNPRTLAKLEPTIPGARIVDFSSPYYCEKLKEQNRYYSKPRSISPWSGYSTFSG